jgi:hypothetical protein
MLAPQLTPSALAARMPVILQFPTEAIRPVPSLRHMTTQLLQEAAQVIPNAADVAYRYCAQGNNRWQVDLRAAPRVVRRRGVGSVEYCGRALVSLGLCRGSCQFPWQYAG